MERGIIFNISKYAIHDGPGIRTTVFLKGCPLRCMWCCSPQSQSFEKQTCKSNGKAYGRYITAEELFSEIRADEPFWRRSHGGVTLSGGEVMAQPDFVCEFLDICKAHYIHTAIESSLAASADTASRITGKADFIQFDIKAFSPELHKALTGIDNRQILENAAKILQTNKPAVVRIPFVPGVNDAVDEIEAIGRFVETHRHGATVELLRYHKMGSGIYEELGRTYELPHVERPTDEEIEKACDVLKNFDLNVLHN